MAGVVAARKSSPNNAPVASRREKVRPTTPPRPPGAKKFAQQRLHLGQTAKKLAQQAQKHRKPAIFAEQGELFRADLTRNEQSTRTTGPARTHKTTCIVPPCPNREKVRPTTPPSRPNREKTRPASSKTPKTDHFCQAGRTFSRFPIRITPQGELFRAAPTRNEQSTHTTGPARTRKRAQESTHKKADATKHPRQGTYTSATGRELLVVHRSLLPLEVIHKLTQ